jgi:multiple sugar transport system substrate-binding protein
VSVLRKIISFILVGFILIWTYNLFINSFIELEEVEEEPYKGIIKIWDIPIQNPNTGSRYNWMQSKIRAFEKRNPGVYIELTPIKNDSLYNKIGNNNDDMPDIVPIDSSFPHFNILEPLDEYFEKEELEEFKHQVLKSVRYNKQLIAVPIGMSTYTMYINLDKFSERGVTPPLNGNWTYEEFIDLLKQFNFDSDGDGIVDEYGFISYIEPKDYSIWGIILSDGGELINHKRIEYSFYGEKAIKGLEKVTDLKQKYNVVPDYFGIINEKDAWKMFYKEQKAAVYAAESWAVNLLDKSYKDGTGFNFDVVNYPTGDKNLPVVLSNDIVSYGVIKSEDTKKMKMCVKFLKSLTTDSNQKSLEEVGLFTVKRGVKDMYIDNPKMKKIEESLSYTHYIPFIDNWMEIDSIIQEEIRNAILGEKLSYEAIEDAKIEIEKLIK